MFLLNIFFVLLVFKSRIFDNFFATGAVVVIVDVFFSVSHQFDATLVVPSDAMMMVVV